MAAHAVALGNPGCGPIGRSDRSGSARRGFAGVRRAPAREAAVNHQQKGARWLP
jgi:hypothetical protein